MVSRRRSAGLLLYRRRGGDVEILIAHPGGPLWARKDDGAWTIPKGLLEPDEEPETTARREFAEEIGSPAPAGPVIELGDVTQASGKVVAAFAVEGDIDSSTVVSNSFEMVWPPRSGKLQSFPEVDRAEWVDPETARVKLNPAQVAFVDRLLDTLASQR
ncbi:MULTISPECIES: NUDIX domain-containing protein [Gordonia]|uniref:NUDIX domain-containing protein n=1 Tax=Gordonia tangerina TaxID=2911060 RepID=A0ABS9DQY6_9ACTN|nr:MULTISPECIES: NUDIX domain-containing protein [Gordonia]MAU82757.1 NUDIX hydrolase [Gordonia sp. (in: high G+C Gram-positive bacteria)]MCF3940351.1 NUDIX domain-containing protein [Gordonia tangerina]